MNLNRMMSKYGSHYLKPEIKNRYQWFTSRKWAHYDKNGI